MRALWLELECVPEQAKYVDLGAHLPLDDPAGATAVRAHEQRHQPGINIHAVDRKRSPQRRVEHVMVMRQHVDEVSCPRRGAQLFRGGKGHQPRIAHDRHAFGDGARELPCGRRLSLDQLCAGHSAPVLHRTRGAAVRDCPVSIRSRGVDSSGSAPPCIGRRPSPSTRRRSAPCPAT